MIRRFIHLTALLALIGFADSALAQTQDPVQFSGVVLQADSISPLPGAIIVVPGTSRGTTSSAKGFFSFAVLIGDEIEVRFVGLKTKRYKVEANSPALITYFAVMREDETYLPIVDVNAFDNVNEFTNKLLNMEDYKPGDLLDSKLINRNLFRRMVKNTTMDASANYKNYVGQMPGDIQNKFMPMTNPFLNVVNWARLIKTIRQKKKADDAERARQRIPD